MSSVRTEKHLKGLSGLAVHDYQANLFLGQHVFDVQKLNTVHPGSTKNQLQA
jgi:hypothetical protein